MTPIKLYIATTIDGYIARKDNSLDWLYELPVPEGVDYGYGDFYGSIDAVVMGRNTYNEILGFDVEWPYANCNTYVITHDTQFQASTPHTSVINDLNSTAILDIRKANNKGVWVVGGGQIIEAFMKLDAIDEMILTIVPTILGDGIRLFPNESKETKFNLVQTESFESGAVNLHYNKK